MTAFSLTRRGLSIPAPGTFGNPGAAGAARAGSGRQFDLNPGTSAQRHREGAWSSASEMYNILNHTNFANPVSRLNNALGTGANQIFSPASRSGAGGRPGGNVRLVRTSDSDQGRPVWGRPAARSQLSAGGGISKPFRREGKARPALPSFFFVQVLSAKIRAGRRLARGCFCAAASVRTGVSPAALIATSRLADASLFTFLPQPCRTFRTGAKSTCEPSTSPPILPVEGLTPPLLHS